MTSLEMIAAHLRDMGCDVVRIDEGRRQPFGSGQWHFGEEAHIDIRGELPDNATKRLATCGPVIINATATRSPNGLTRVPFHLEAEVIRIERWPDDTTTIRFGHALKLDYLAQQI